MKSLLQLLSWNGRMGRKSFAISGAVLFVIKYNIDRLISLADYNRPFYIWNYFIQQDVFAVSKFGPSEWQYYQNLLLVSLPFIWLGTMLCFKRLRDAGLPLWMVVLFFVPFVNLIFFMLLCLLPSSENNLNLPEKHKNRLLDSMIPKSKEGSVAVAIGGVVVLALLLAAFSIQILKEYGWHLFIGIPFFIGLGSVLIYGYHEPRTLKASLSVGFISVVFFSIMILAVAIEGLLCVIMAAPIALGLALLGASLGYVIQHRVNHHTPHVFFSILGFLPILALVEHAEERQAHLIEVKTSVIVQSTPEVVWKNLVAFNEIDAPKELLFRSGIAYPIKAKIKGCGKGAVRECIFTTGPFIEPIEVWDEPRLMRFSVLDQPPPMVEWSFYPDLHAPHLEGYFTSEKGQFLLTPLKDGSTKLEGTTWYRHRIWPASYWKVWSDFILHRIHLRVLNHIKKQSEKGHATH